MSNEKIKPKLNGTAETMLQCFYARAMHSRNPKNVCMETLCPYFVKKENIEKSIQATGAMFTWGANSFAELGDIAAGFRKVNEYSGWFYISCPVIWKSLFRSVFVHTES